MFRIFVAVFLALAAFRCAVSDEPRPYDVFKLRCEQVNAGQGAPAGWCDCLAAEMQKRDVSEESLAAAMDHTASPEAFLAVQREVQAAAEDCRASLRGELRL